MTWLFHCLHGFLPHRRSRCRARCDPEPRWTYRQLPLGSRSRDTWCWRVKCNLTQRERDNLKYVFELLLTPSTSATAWTPSYLSRSTALRPPCGRGCFQRVCRRRRTRSRWCAMSAAAHASLPATHHIYIYNNTALWKYSTTSPAFKTSLQVKVCK